jgi:hypothetical protein
MTEDFPVKDKSRRNKRRKRNYQTKRFHEERDGEFRPKVVESKKRKTKKINIHKLEDYSE